MKILEIVPGQRKPVLQKLSPDEKFDQVWTKLIKPNCSDIIDLYKREKRVFYRGEKGAALIYRGASRDQRPPKDSRADLSLIFDMILKDAGFTALRSNSIFVTSDLYHAEGFGRTYIIFPFNGIDYTWVHAGDIILDSYVDIIKSGPNFTMQIKFAKWYEKETGAFPSDIDWKYHWQNVNRGEGNGIFKALNNAKYYLSDDPWVQSISIEDFIDKDWIIKKFNPKNTDLSVALQNKYEVMIRGQYYAISYDAYRNRFREKLGFLPV